MATARLLTPEELRRIRLPVQLVYGDRDVFVPADHAVAIHRQLPDSRLLICPNSPHQVMVSQPALFNLAAGNFYRSTEKVARERAERGARGARRGRRGRRRAGLRSRGGRGGSRQTTATSRSVQHLVRGEELTMAATLLAIYKRPEGGDEALRRSGSAIATSTCR